MIQTRWLILSFFRIERLMRFHQQAYQCVYRVIQLIHLRVHLQGPFRNPHLTPLMKWLFGDVINYFKLLDFKKNVKIGMRSISKIYSLSTAAQCPNQLYGNKTYRFSSLNPPPSRNTLVRGRKK